LESNPEVLTEYIHALGVSPEWRLEDVIGLDEELLAFVPQPCAAMILLFPIKSAVGDGSGDANPNVFFMKQTIGNACGTVALLHSIVNNTKQIGVLPDTPLDRFIKASKDKSPDEIGKLLEESEEIQAVHEKYAQKGQTDTPGLNSEVDLHFVSIVLADGHVNELDGRKDGPVKKDASDDGAFLKHAAKVSKEYIDAMPGEKSFSLMALVKKGD